jgi:hypothetical protein
MAAAGGFVRINTLQGGISTFTKFIKRDEFLRYSSEEE